ncbi:hypothetical protein ADMFC3_06640 [Geovibrio sp. ADMFC3]|jgi:hypothetical protein|nr:putative motility protein [Deferribacteraceae bacterium]
MDVASLASGFTQMSQAEYTMQASVTVAKKALDLQETQGQAVLKLLQAAELPKNSGGEKGNLLDVIA